jgi:hypothetical protein
MIAQKININLSSLTMELGDFFPTPLTLKITHRDSNLLNRLDLGNFQAVTGYSLVPHSGQKV